jgi:hypothetical protein
MFLALGMAGLILGWGFAIAMVIAGRMLQSCQAYVFCIVMAAIACAWMPFGTILGVFTIIVLVRPSVKELFETGYNPSIPIEEMDPS